MRGDSRLFGAAAVLTGVAVAVACAVSPATAGTKKRTPKIAYAEFTENPANESEYRFKVGAIRSASVVVELKESPAEGKTTGPKETIALDKNGGTSSPVVWTGFTSKVRGAPCYRAAYIARNPRGRYAITHRLCIFGHHGEPTVRVAPW